MGTLLIDAHNSIMGIPLQTENRFSVILLTVLPKELHDVHYHLEVQANPNKIVQKTMLFLASMGKTGLTHDIFF